MPTLSRNSIRSLAIGVVALLALGGVSSAQIDTASIVGTVRDPSGAVVAKAKVNVQNMATNEVQTAVSGDEGLYSFPYLRVGTYSVTVEAAGFKTTVRNDIVLNVQDRKQVDFQLQVGSSQQRVDVTTEAPLLDTQTADVGNVVSGQQATDLPLNGRRYDALTGLTAGVNTSSPSFQQRAEGVFSVNGNSSTQNNFVLDGGDNNSYTTNLQDQSAQGVQPAVDSLAEFKLQTRDYDVEYGRSAGGVVNVAIKSGTNGLHGDVYEYFRNDKLDARDYFATSGPKPILQQNQFGFTLGGPIRKDKTFFFVNWEARRIRNGLTLQGLVPTPQMRNLDFTEFPAANLPRSPNIPGMPQVSNCINNGVLTNNSTCVDPTAQQLLALYPSPNLNTSSEGVPGSFTYGANYIGHPKETQDSDEGAVRIDHRFSDADNVYGHLVIFDLRQNRPGIFSVASPIADGTNDSTSGVNLDRGTSITMAWVHMFRPNIVNDGHFSFTRVASHNIQATLGQNVNRQYGLNGIPIYPGLSGGLPEIDISGMQLLGSPMWLPQNQFAQIWQLKDAVTFIKGSHSLKMGVEWRRDADNFSDLCCIRGNYGFNSQYTGQGITDFLMGLPNHAELENLDIARIYRNGWNWFVSDSWRVNQKLTLTYGVRYEYSSPLFERNNHETNFGPNLNGGQGGLFTVPANASGTLQRTTVHPVKTNLAPRVGFAYSLMPKLVMRGGFGLYYQNSYRYGSESMLALDPPFLVDAQANAQPGQAPTILLRNGFPSSFLNPVDVNDTAAVAQLFIRAIDTNLKPSTIYQASYGFQYSLTSNFVLEANYVLNRGRHLWDLENRNQPQLVTPGLPPVLAFPNFVQTSGSPTYIEWLTSLGNSTYNALQINADRRFSHGMGLHVAYTWSKALSQVSDFEAGLRGIQDRYNRKAEWAYWDNDSPNRLAISGTYQLPIGRGHRVASSGAMEKIAGDWQVNTIATFASGQPITVGITQDNSRTGSGNRPDCTAAASGFHRSIAGWVNPSGFAAPAQYTFGNCSPTPGPRAPGISLIDISLFKNFSFSESKYLQFRIEAFNFINKPQFGPPSNLSWDTSQPGTVGAPVPGFGAITSTVPNLQRQLQFALKFYF
jgi:Carboxypeptidase regulatory-like domain